MYLQNVCIKNYKSLRQVNFSPKSLSVIVGPNASGKSNFADALHFLSEVYSHGLELAIARKGGYENIAFRRQRRTKSPLFFQITFDIEGADLSSSYSFKEVVGLADASFRLTHQFTMTTASTGIKAAFRVDTEKFEVQIRDNSSTKFDSLFSIEREKDDAQPKITSYKGNHGLRQAVSKLLGRYFWQ